MNKPRVDAAELGAMLEAVSVAASRDRTRPSLGAVSFLIRADGLSLVATDMYRLVVAQIGAAHNWRAREGEEALVPLDEAQALVQYLSGERRAQVSVEGTVLRVKAGKGKAAFEAEAPDAQFRNWERVLPDTPSPQRMSAPRASLIAACEQCRRGDKGGLRSLGFRAVAGTVTAESCAVDDKPIPLDGLIVGELVGLSSWLLFEINPTYLRQAVETIRAEEVVLELNGPFGPVGLHGTDGQDLHWLIMPMQTVPLRSEDFGDEYTWSYGGTVPVTLELGKGVAFELFRVCAERGEKATYILGELVEKWLREQA